MKRLPPDAPSDLSLYKFARGLLRTGLRLYGRHDVAGVWHLPVSGPAIVVANHPSDIDPIILGVAFPRPLHFMADAVQFRRGFVGRVIPRLGAIPVRKGEPNRAALRTALDLLAAGEVVALFPEGDLYADDTMHPFERGIGYLAAESGAPVVPAAITGAYAISDGRWLRRPTIRLTVGAPIDFGGLGRRGHDAYARRAALVEAAVRELRVQGERSDAAWCKWPCDTGLGEGDEAPEGEPAGI